MTLQPSIEPFTNSNSILFLSNVSGAEGKLNTSIGGNITHEALNTCLLLMV